MKLAVIPARGGSKRIPRKNIKLFAGKPMIAYAIEVARATGIFSRIVVSTDDPEIAAAAEQHGAEVPFMRPASLANDHTPTVPVVAHAIETLELQGWHASQVCCIYPGVPMLRVDDLNAGLAMLEEGKSAYAFPVVAFASPIQRALRRNTDGSIAPFHPEYAVTRTQDLESAYHDAGQFYWGSSTAWRQGLELHTHGRTLVVHESQAVDIDTPADWERAEALYRIFTTQVAV